MRKNFNIYFCIIFLTSLNANNNLKNVIVNGNERVSDETIKIYGDIEVNKKIDDKKINNILRNLYETNFFEDIKIKFENNVLEINVVEFPVINQLLFVGEPSNKIKNELKKNISLKEKDSFIKANLARI